GQNGINFSVPGKNTHLSLFVKRLPYFLIFFFEVVFHMPPPLGLFYSPFINSLFFSGSNIYKRRSGVSFLCVLYKKFCLKLFHMLAYSFFSIFLHSCIDSCVNSQPIQINAIFTSIRLWVFISPILEPVPQIFPKICG